MKEEPNSFDLLRQLESILESDPLIDEVGFVHPTQFVELNKGIDGSSNLSVGDKLADRISDFKVICYDSTVFWNQDHKLAISTEALLSLYKAAKLAYMTANGQYQTTVKLPADEGVADSDTSLENELMKHSKSLLILSYDFGGAWNSRKLVVSRKQSFSIYMEELQFSALILSYGPKSEHAWNHRRWVIKMVAESYPGLPNVLEGESRLVEKIAEKSKMNYRAWHHRCWLVPYMTSRQVLDELNQSRKWAELHIADNCCFHYRRRLMLRMLKDDSLEHDPQTCTSYNFVMLLKEELKWNELLIKRYVAREALWMHRRFLSLCWIEHFRTDQHAFCHHSEDISLIHHCLDAFLGNELELFSSCFNISDEEFDNDQVSSKLAAAYILWISKKIPSSQGGKIQEKLREQGGINAILNKVSPEKSSLWKDLTA